MLRLNGYGLFVTVVFSAFASQALALGVIPKPERDGNVSTPAPIAGAGLVWLGIAGAGGYLLYRYRRRRD